MRVVTSSIVDFYTFLAFEREINEQSHMNNVLCNGTIYCD